MPNMDIIQIFESGSTVALALVVWHETKAVRASVEKLGETINELLTKDMEARIDSAQRLGENMGIIKANLGELLDEKRANGSDTSHEPASPAHLPPHSRSPMGR